MARSKQDDLREKLLAVLQDDGDDDDADDGTEVHVQRGSRTTILRGRRAREYVEANKLLDGDDEEDDEGEEDDDGEPRGKAKRKKEDEEEDDAPQRGKRRIFSGYGDE